MPQSTPSQLARRLQDRLSAWWAVQSAPDGRRAWGRRGVIGAGGLGAVLLTLVLILLLLDWNMLRGPVSAFASARTGRDISIEGPLSVRPWSLRPSATVQGLRIADPDWAGEGDTATVERLTVQMEILPLLRGRQILTRLELHGADVRLRRAADGQVNWDFSPGDRDEGPARLPAIRRFVVQDGRLALRDDVRGLNFSGEVSAREGGGEAGAQGFRLLGEGQLNGEAFRLRARGAPLVNLDPDEPYGFGLDITAGRTEITARGALMRPFDFGQLNLRLEAAGPDLAYLYQLTGLAFPNTPPYRLEGRLRRDEQVWTVTGLGGRIGDSDLAGDLKVDVRGERPLLTAELSSRVLDFDDLAALFGGAPSTAAGETLAPQQAAMAAKLRQERRYFPDAPLDVRRIRSMDAELTYRAERIEAPDLPLRGGRLRLSLKDGVLDARELAFTLPQGAFAGQIVLDAREDTPRTSLDMRLTGARLETLLPVGEGPAPLSGDLVGRVKLSGAGLSVRQTMASADGEVLLVIPRGEIREAFAELLGINVTRGLGLLLSDDQSRTEVRCAVAHFRARNGVMRADPFIFDTTPVLGQGAGEINLGEEQLDLRIDGEPKEPRLVRLMAPVTVRGPFAAPQIGVETGAALAQGGLGLALGALAAPLAALLPFVDPGLAEDANCGALVGEARQQGAPAE
ncbi:AsmA family protein [Phenylobacterium sp.]|uniref:AsmA family protein n=1 Tax=Phenylobacterium sp. TaxID=1871053 RepID=UPI002FDB9267